MLRAMDSAVSGLRAHQNKLDVLGNNIANVNTFGFKAQTYSFKDTMYQTSNASTTGATDSGYIAQIGGTNASQYGYGALMGSISTDFTSSTPTYVGGSNASINGSGFFITNKDNMDTDSPSNAALVLSTADDPSRAMKDANFAYTRVGQFTLDANGYLVDSNQNFVYGFRPEDGGTLSAGLATYDETKTLVPIRAPQADDLAYNSTTGVTGTFTGTVENVAQLKSLEIGQDGSVKGVVEVDDNGKPRTATIVLGWIALATFQNQEGLTKAGNNTFNATTGDNTGIVEVAAPGVGAAPVLMAGYLESSNTDLAKEFSDMITAERGFQANTKMVTVSDEILQELVNMKR